MIVCHCQVVSDRAVAAAIADGARTLAEVCRATGAGQDVRLLRVLPQAAGVPARAERPPPYLPEVHSAAS